MKKTRPGKNCKFLLHGLITFLLFVICSHAVFAQKITVTGTVTDKDNGQPLPGGNIMIKGTTSGTITDANGAYEIEVDDPGSILVFSYISYKTMEIQVGDQLVINISLELAAEDLEQVVVIGYGVQKKKLVTGATVHVDNEEIQKKNSLRIEQAIQGLTPGVHVTSKTGQPGEKPKVRIRGIGTVGNSDPIYVVDGVVTDDVRYLNPSDVESVDILKDAASAAIYGTRAANGVILITTKKGQAGKMRLTYDGYYGIQNAVKKLDLLNAQEYMMIMNEAADNVGSIRPFTSMDSLVIGEGIDWQDLLFLKNAPTYSHSLSFSGGSEESNFSSSVSYFKQHGIIGQPGKSSYERISGRFNSQHKVYKDIVTIGQNLVYSHSYIRGVGIGDIWGTSNLVRFFVNASPVIGIYNDSYEDGFARSWVSDKEPNPYAIMEYSGNTWERQDKLLGNIFTDIKLLKGLKYTFDFGFDLGYYYKTTYEPAYELTETMFNQASSVEMETGRDFTSQITNYLTYTKSLADNNFTFLLGSTFENYTKFKLLGFKEELGIDDFDHAVIDNATNTTTQRPEGERKDRKLVSYYGRINWNLNEKYLASATMRIDGSSRFGPENRFATFPSFSAGWVLSEEEFIDLPVLDYFKLRGSWGRNGNDKIPDFGYSALIDSDPAKAYYFGQDVRYVGSSPVKIDNPKLQWEKSEQIDIGFDSRFLEKFSLSFDVYKKTTRDWLVIPPVAAIAGNDPPIKNGGSVENKGIELDFGYQKMTGDFIFSINANIAYNINEVIEIDNDEGIIHGPGPGDGSSTRHILFNQCPEVYQAKEGYPIAYFVGYESLGIFQSQEEINNYFFIDEDGDTSMIQRNAEPGDIKFADLNNDGEINTDDLTMIGDPNPDITYGVSFNAQYKGFDFAVFLQGIAGNQVLFGIRNYNEVYPNYTTDVLDRWHGPGTSTTHPRVTLAVNDNYLKISDLFVKDGSYLKVRSINVGYDLKRTVLKNIPIQKVRLYFSVNNVFTFTKYPGYDPEVGYGDYEEDRYENFSTGIDIGYYPVPRSYMIGLNVEF